MYKTYSKKKIYYSTKNNTQCELTRYELLKVACEHQPETYEEQLLRELNQHYLIINNIKIFFIILKV